MNMNGHGHPRTRDKQDVDFSHSLICTRDLKNISHKNEEVFHYGNVPDGKVSFSIDATRLDSQESLSCTEASR